MTHTYEGKPCKLGHTTRYISGSHCVACKQSAALARYHAAQAAKAPTLVAARPKVACKSAKRARAATPTPSYDSNETRELWLAAGNTPPASGLFSGWPCRRGHTLRDAERGCRCVPCESLRRVRALAIGYDNMGDWIEAGNVEPDPSSPTFIGWRCRNGHTLRSTEAPWGCLECREESRLRSSKRAAEQYDAAALWAYSSQLPVRLFGDRRVLILSEDPKVWLAQILGPHEYWGFKRRFLERTQVSGGAEFEYSEDGLYETGRVTVGDGRVARAFVHISGGCAEFVSREQAHQIAEARP